MYKWALVHTRFVLELSKEAQGNLNAARSEPWPDLKIGAWLVALCAGKVPVDL